jgi:tRNA dimethylallyltransferase
MMAADFLEEVRALKARGDLDPAMPSMRAVGYRQLWEYLAGECDLEEAVRRGVVASRRYAKRQMTWFRGDPDIRWFDAVAPDVEKRLSSAVDGFLSG